MKKKIVSLCALTIALILEIIPYGVKMNWADDAFYERVSYHSYFDLTVWGYGDMAPFVCAIITIVCLGMLFASLFFKQHKSYSLAVSILSFVSVVLSIVPSLFGSYTLFGLLITVLLSVATEINIMIFLNQNK